VGWISRRWVAGLHDHEEGLRLIGDVSADVSAARDDEARRT